jgi:hypothetical protein
MCREVAFDRSLGSHSVQGLPRCAAIPRANDTVISATLSGLRIKHATVTQGALRDPGL